MRTLLSMTALLLIGSAAWGEMYTWKDRRGTVFYTNSIHEIPARYLKKARVLDVATGKKGGLVTQQAATPAATAPQGQGQVATPAIAAAPPMTLASPPPPSPAPTAVDPAAGSAAQQLTSPTPPPPASVATPPVQGRVVLPRRPHRLPRREE